MAKEQLFGRLATLAHAGVSEGIAALSEMPPSIQHLLRVALGGRVNIDDKVITYSSATTPYDLNLTGGSRYYAGFSWTEKQNDQLARLNLVLVDSSSKLWALGEHPPVLTLRGSTNNYAPLSVEAAARRTRAQQMIQDPFFAVDFIRELVPLLEKAKQAPSPIVVT